MDIVLNVETIGISEEAATANEIVALNPVVLLVCVLVKSDVRVVDDIGVLKSMAVRLAWENSSNRFADLDSTGVPDGVSSSVTELAENLAIQVEVRALVADGDVVSAWVDLRVKGEGRVEGSSLAWLDVDNLYKRRG